MFDSKVCLIDCVGVELGFACKKFNFGVGCDCGSFSVIYLFI